MEVKEGRFHVFGYYQYYPGGGMHDHMGGFETVEAALDRINDRSRGQRDVHDLVEVRDGAIVELDLHQDWESGTYSLREDQ